MFLMYTIKAILKEIFKNLYGAFLAHRLSVK